MSSKNAFCIGKKAKLFVKTLDAYQFFKNKFLKRNYNQKLDPKKIKRILLTNWANLGDVFLATSIIPVLKKSFPGCKIGFLIAPHTRVVLDGNEDIEWIHEIENWSIKKYSSIFERLIHFFHYLRNVSVIADQIKKNQYDCAIELYPFFPNTISLAWKSRIPVRIGFNTSGNSQLLTHCVSWMRSRYLPLSYTDLLAEIGISVSDVSLLSPFIPKKGGLDLPDHYLLFHVNSSAPCKELPSSFWRGLAIQCQDFKCPIFFTGKGKREKEIIDEIIKDLPHCRNLSNAFSWEGLVEVIGRAQVVISIDSVPVHVATALKVPLISIYVVSPFLDIWRPNHPKAFFFVNKEIRTSYISPDEQNIISFDILKPELVCQIIKKLI